MKPQELEAPDGHKITNQNITMLLSDYPLLQPMALAKVVYQSLSLL